MFTGFLIFLLLFYYVRKSFDPKQSQCLKRTPAPMTREEQQKLQQSQTQDSRKANPETSRSLSVCDALFWLILCLVVLYVLQGRTQNIFVSAQREADRFVINSHS